MKTYKKEILFDEEVTDPLEKALELLINDLSYGEALEYCADQIELTRTLRKIAVHQHFM